MPDALGFNLTSYYAKRIIGDEAAGQASSALLRSGSFSLPSGMQPWNVWLFSDDSMCKTDHPYGIFHHRGALSNGQYENINKIELIGGQNGNSNSDIIAGWIRMTTGDTYILGKVGIGYDPETPGNNYKLYVNGSVYFEGAIDLSGNLIPNTTNTYSLGDTTHRWSALYIGTADTYGNAYTPVYWNAGVPTTVSVVQKSPFSFANESVSTTVIRSNCFTEDTIVISIVVTSGESNLNGKIEWSSNTNIVTLSTPTATSGVVSGYIITAQGIEWTTAET